MCQGGRWHIKWCWSGGKGSINNTGAASNLRKHEQHNTGFRKLVAPPMAPLCHALAFFWSLVPSSRIKEHILSSIVSVAGKVLGGGVGGGGQKHESLAAAIPTPMKAFQSATWHHRRLGGGQSSQSSSGTTLWRGLRAANDNCK